MVKKFGLFVLILLGFACKTNQLVSETVDTSVSNTKSDSVFVITFGSCNRHNVENVYWDDILALNPDVWIWGGDNIYADTDNMNKMQAMYEAQKAVPAYSELTSKIPVIGTWDDHDYGVNDGGEEFPQKEASQQLFLDFMGVAKDDVRRTRKGVYASHIYEKDYGKVKIIVLDTRFFRTELEKSNVKGHRYGASDEEGTILGKTQWQWLTEELNSSDADFNIIVSSIQFLSNLHGYEKWANYPNEVEKMKLVIRDSKAKGVFFISGDRHYSDFSRSNVDGIGYPIIDFTSSGLTHAYTSFKGESNPYRVGSVISTTSFGMIELNLERKEAHFKIMGESNIVYEEMKQQY